MTIATFPTLRGLVYPIGMTPIWRTLTQEAISGLDSRTQLWTYPRYRFSVEVSVARSASDWLTLCGFWNSIAGAALPFHYTKPDDSTVTLQTIGTGDGTTRQFNFVRSLGGFVEPVQDVSAVSAVTVDSVAETHYTLVSDANWGCKYAILFDSGHAPANGKLVKASFTYSWACRFDRDMMDMQNFANAYWSMGRIPFTSMKVL